MLNFLKNILDDNARIVKKLSKTVDEINALEPSVQALDNEGLRAKTLEFKKRLADGETLDDILPEAFAVVREASVRTLGMRHFDVQLIGGIVLHQGRISEMRTGEGKTLVATLPAYLNALSGKGVHIITVNDYLARRDSDWMGRIHRFLGLSVGLIVHGLDFEERKQSYAADITYGTNNEFGFDYLRDNMVIHKDQMVQRDLNYAIVDEVDSILIDEARTPLIISGPAEKPTELYFQLDRVVRTLRKDEDFNVDEKAHNVDFTEQGEHKVGKAMGLETLAENAEVFHHARQAIKAHALMKRDRDYVVKDGEVIIVDEFTGRLMFGRRYSDGLHQAIEAKEGVKIERESQTLATITFQNYFRMYKKLSGMTGTALTEEDEFRKIYGLDVVVIPTHRAMVRKDLADSVYKAERGKFKAVVEEIVERHAVGQPLLVGTISIETSEMLSDMLKRRGVPHNVLNAKYHEREAEIIAQAGRKGAVTIATNMAGRGTDILLGGNPEFLAQAELRRRHMEQAQAEQEFSAELAAVADGIDPEAANSLYEKLLEDFKKKTDEEHAEVVNLGGLHIMGTERHESRRIDNQLRGRAGRQGDPGSTRFYISLEDDLMRLFGSDNITGLMDRLGMEEDMPIENALITRSIEAAQKRVESRNFDMRKHVLEYDDVMNKQREVIYEQRRKVLVEENLREVIADMIRDTISDSVSVYCPEGVHPEEWDYQGLLHFADQLYLPGHEIAESALEEMNRQEITEFLFEKSLEKYGEREEQIGAEDLRELERRILLHVVDEKWMDHLDAMDQLREGVGLRAYGQKDPLIEYKFEGYEMFQNMIASVKEDVVRYIFRVNVVREPEKPRQWVENRYAEEGVRQPVKAENKIGRNDPCPCGSGKKYKKCCGR